MSLALLLVQLKILLYTILTVKNWEITVFYRLTWWFKPKHIILRNGVQLKTRDHLTNDLSIITELWKFEPYTDQIFFSIKEADIVFDVWWHMGNFALYASLRATQWHVHVFEPTQENYQLLDYNIRHNHAKNVTINNCAIGDKNASIQFIESKNDKASHSKFWEIAHWETRTITVDQITLWSYIDKNHIKRINFLKLDCEWAEYEILYTLPSEYLKKIEKISMEIHDNIPGHTREQMIEFLENTWFVVDIKEVYIGIYNIFAINKNFSYT